MECPLLHKCLSLLYNFKCCADSGSVSTEIYCTDLVFLSEIIDTDNKTIDFLTV